MAEVYSKWLMDPFTWATLRMIFLAVSVLSYIPTAIDMKESSEMDSDMVMERTFTMTTQFILVSLWKTLNKAWEH